MGRRAVQAPVLALPPIARLVVPVFGAVGGAGASVVAGLLTARLRELLPPPQAVAVIDTAAAEYSPWIAAASARPAYGAGDLDRLDPRTHLSAACWEVAVAGGSVRLLANEPHQPGAEPAPLRGPQHYPGLIFPVQALVIDAGAGEGRRLADQVRGARPGALAEWVAFGQVALAPVWVTPATGWGLSRLIAAISNAESAGIGARHWTVVVNHRSAAALPRPVKAQLAMVVDRVSTVRELRRRAGLESGASPLLEALRAPPDEESLSLALHTAAAAGLNPRDAAPPVGTPARLKKAAA